VSCMQEVGLKTVPLGFIWRGAYGSDMVLGTNIQLPQRIVIKEEGQCWIKKGGPWLTGSKGPKIHPLTYPNHQHVHCMDDTMPLLSKSDGYVFRCFTNNPSFDIRSSWVLADGRRLLVLEQLKKKTTKEECSPMLATKIRMWWVQASSIVSKWADEFQFLVVFIFLSNYPIKWDIEKSKLIKECPSLLVYDCYNIGEYLSLTFSPLV